MMIQTGSNVPLREMSLLSYFAQNPQENLVFVGKNGLVDGSTPAVRLKPLDPDTKTV